MTVATAALALVLALAAAPAAAQAPQSAQAPQAFAPKEETPEQYPPGPGRDEAVGMCGACHAYRLVAAQGMGRERWDETMTLMTEKHGMPKLEGERRKTILDYLAAAHPAKKPTGAGGFQIPF